MKLDNSLFVFNDDVFLCNVYVPPTSSNILNDRNIDFYEEIEKGIEQNRTLFRFAHKYIIYITHIYKYIYIYIFQSNGSLFRTHTNKMIHVFYAL